MPFLRLNAKNGAIFGLLSFAVFCICNVPVRAASEASLFLAPASGTYIVGSTFDVTVFLDTHGVEANTVEVSIKFSPDILQVIKPLGGSSFVQSWFSPPAFSNKEGTLTLVGGLGPGGVNTSNGLITVITFRAVAPGDAALNILKSSRVLAHNGQGTDLLGSWGSALYAIRVRPPEGPEVGSPTHPDSSRWYQNNAPTFTWQNVEGSEGFSFALDENPETVPPAEIQTNDLVRSFSDISDGIKYFHLRVRKDGAWSGATHLAIRIDASPPQPFTPETTYTPQTGEPPILKFETKDLYSGIDHYAVKVIRTDPGSGQDQDVTPFFLETESPYKVPVSFPGKYAVVVRAFDKAGNTRDASVTLVTPTVALLSDQGIKFKNYFVPFKFIYIFFGFLLAALVFWGLYVLRNLRALRVRVRQDISSLSQDMQKEYLRFGEHLTHEMEGRMAPTSKPASLDDLPPPPDAPSPPPR